MTHFFKQIYLNCIKKINRYFVAIDIYSIGF